MPHRGGRHLPLPHRTALIRLVGTVPAKKNDEWTEARLQRRDHRVAVDTPLQRT
jgi:hypothetical protein